MHYRTLGKTGILVSEIGFGCWGIGGTAHGGMAYGATDDTVSLQALEKALDLGITFFDTSNLYGAGHSEVLLGKATRKCRDKVIIATKGGFTDKGDTQDWSPFALRSSLEGSLQRLNTDYVDLLQLHSPEIAALEDGALFELLKGFVTEGKIRSWGVSVRSPEDAKYLLGRFYGEIPVLQVNFSAVDQRALECGLLAASLAQQVGVVARTPLCFGFLTGQYQAITFDKGDHRARWSSKQIKLWADAYRKFISEECDLSDQTAAQLALRYCISFPSISCTIPGMLTPSHVLENASASGLGPLPSTTLSYFQKVYRGNEFVASSK